MISACMIVRDEAENLERTLPVFRPFVDEINVVDTGSRDGTLELLDRFASEPGPPIRVEQAEWTDNFSTARAQSLAMAARDWVLAIDADEILIGGEHLARNIERADRYDVGMVSAPWDFADNPVTGQPIVQLHGRGFIVNRRRGSFEGLVHEQWRPHGGGDWPLNPQAWVYADGIVLRHLRRRLASERYLPLLERAAADPAGTRTPRALLYLGLELFRAGRFEEARSALRSYLADEWDECEGHPNRWRLMALQVLVETLRGIPATFTRQGFPLLRWAMASLREYERLPMTPRPADGWVPAGGPLL